MLHAYVEKEINYAQYSHGGFFFISIKIDPVFLILFNKALVQELTLDGVNSRGNFIQVLLIFGVLSQELV